MITLSEQMDIVVKLAKKDPAVRKAFIMADRRPERVLQQYKSLKPLSYSLKYFTELTKLHPEYSTSSRVSGAILGAIARTYTSNAGKGLIVLGGEMVFTGAVQVGAGPATLGTSIITGGGTILVGAGGVALGEWALDNGDKFGFQIAEGYSGIENSAQKEGGYVRFIKKSVKGLITSKFSNNGTYTYIKNSDFIASTPEQMAAYRREFKKILAENDSLSDSEKLEMLNRLDQEQKAAIELSKSGVNVRELAKDEALFDKLVHTDSMQDFIDEQLKNVKLEDLGNTPLPIQLKSDNTGYEYNWSLIDPNGKTLPWRSPLIQWMAENTGMLDAKGYFKISSDENIPPVSNNNYSSRSKNLSTLQSPVSDDSSKYLQFLLRMNVQELEDLNIIKNQLTAKLADGTEITAGQALAILVDDYYARQKEQKMAKRYETLKGAADLVTRAGQLIDCKALVYFGQTSSALIDMGFSVMRMYGGDWTASITFFNSILSTVSLFKKKPEIDFNQIILGQLQNISEQIEALSKQIRENHIQISEQLYALHRLARKEFSEMSMQLYVNQIIVTRRLDQIEISLAHLSKQLHVQAQQLWLKDLLDTASFIQNYKVRIGNFDLINYDTFTQMMETLVSWMTQKAGLSNSNGAHFYSQGSSVKYNLNILRHAEPADILGFLTKVAINEFNVDILADLTINNPNIWLMAAFLYLDLLKKCNPEDIFEYDPQLAELRQIFQTAKSTLEINKQLSMNHSLFTQLLNGYELSLRLVYDNLKLLSNLSSNDQNNILIDNVITEQRTVLQSFQPPQYVCDVDNISGNAKKHDGVPIQRARIWNQTIANDRLVKFNKEYQTELWAQIDFLESEGFKTQSPIFTFVQFDNIILPLVKLFNSDDSVKLPQTLLNAEKKALGKFIFTLVATVGVKVKYTVVMEFKYKEDKFKVATVTLEWLVENEFVEAMVSLGHINDAGYGKEWANSYLANTSKVIETVKKILGWRHGKMMNIEYTNLDSENNYKTVCQELDKIENQTIMQLANQVLQNKPANNSAEYTGIFDELQEILEQHELNVLYLKAFTQIAAFPQTLSKQIQQLWTKEDIVNNFRVIANTEDSTLVNFEETIEYHLTGKLPKEKEDWKSLVAVTKGGFTLILKSFDTHIWNAITRPNLPTEGFAIEQFLHVLHAETKRLNDWYFAKYKQRLALEDLDSFLPEKMITDSPAPSQVYSGIEVSTLLTSLKNDNNFILLPPYYPNDKEPFEFCTENLNTEIAEGFTTIQQQIQENKPISSLLLPVNYEDISYEIEQTSNQKSWISWMLKSKSAPIQKNDGSLWVMVAVKVVGKNKNKLRVYYLNPLGLDKYKEKSSFGLSHKLKKESKNGMKFILPIKYLDEIKYKELNFYAVPVMKYFYPQIPVYFNTLRSHFWCPQQITIDKWRDSGAVMIKNTQDWLTNNGMLTLGSNITSSTITSLRIAQLETLRLADIDIQLSEKDESNNNDNDNNFAPADMVYFNRIGLMNIPKEAHLVFAKAPPEEDQAVTLDVKNSTLSISGSGTNGLVNISNFSGTTESTAFWSLAPSSGRTDVYVLQQEDSALQGTFAKTGILSIPDGMSLVYTAEPSCIIENTSRTLSATAEGSSSSKKAGHVSIMFNCKTEAFTSICFQETAAQLQDTVPTEQPKCHSDFKQVAEKLKKVGFFKMPADCRVVIKKSDDVKNRVAKQTDCSLAVSGSGNNTNFHIGIYASGTTEKFETLTLNK